jgi:DNA invertase Pin-like site-specific DNA recombinase
MIRERTHAGLHEARTRGRVPEGKPNVAAEQSPALQIYLKIHPAIMSRVLAEARLAV